MRLITKIRFCPFCGQELDPRLNLTVDTTHDSTIGELYQLCNIVFKRQVEEELKAAKEVEL